jgi:hypothetical protein
MGKRKQEALTLGSSVKRLEDGEDLREEDDEVGEGGLEDSEGREGAADVSSSARLLLCASPPRSARLLLCTARQRGWRGRLLCGVSGAPPLASSNGDERRVGFGEATSGR